MEQLNFRASSNSFSDSEKEKNDTTQEKVRMKLVTEPTSANEHLTDAVPPVLELVVSASMGRRSRFHQDCTTMDETHWSTGKDLNVLIAGKLMLELSQMYFRYHFFQISLLSSRY